MSRFGTVMRWLFKPITVPFKWLFGHRCKFEDGASYCDGPYCPVGKDGVKGWTNAYRGGEWIFIPPIRPPARPFPKLDRYKDGYRIIGIHIAEKRVDEFLRAYGPGKCVIYLNLQDPWHRKLGAKLVARGRVVKQTPKVTL